MRTLTACGAVVASVIFSGAAFAQVGVGEPACHTQGTLWRMANNCPPESIARARQEHPVGQYAYPSEGHYYHHRYGHWRHYRHHRVSEAHPY
jgi:hypothetical protein